MNRCGAVLMARVVTCLCDGGLCCQTSAARWIGVTGAHQHECSPGLDSECRTGCAFAMCTTNIALAQGSHKASPNFPSPQIQMLPEMSLEAAPNRHRGSATLAIPGMIRTRSAVKQLLCALCVASRARPLLTCTDPEGPLPSLPP